MKDYLNLFYVMIDKLHEWKKLSKVQKTSLLKIFINKSADHAFLVVYFNKYRLNLLNKTLNSYIKGVNKT